MISVKRFGGRRSLIKAASERGIAAFTKKSKLTHNHIINLLLLKSESNISVISKGGLQ